MIFSTESKAPRLRTLGLFETLGLRDPGFPLALLEAIRGVTAEDMNAFVREVLDPAKALRITVGPGPDGPADK